MIYIQTLGSPVAVGNVCMYIGDPLCQDPLCLAKAGHQASDPLTPKSAKRALRGGTESEGKPLCAAKAGVPPVLLREGVRRFRRFRPFGSPDSRTAHPSQGETPVEELEVWGPAP